MTEQLIEAGFTEDTDGRFTKRGWMDTFIGLKFTNNKFVVSVCSVSDSDFTDIGTFETITEAIQMANNQRNSK